MDVAEWVEEIRAGDRRALGRALTEIENRRPAADALLRKLFPFSGRSRTIGITGAAGVGKSTLVSRLVAAFRREDKQVGVIAVDPSSPLSGGAVLGDRVRMLSHSGDPGVFIRSMATRGAMGGLAPATADMTLALAAAGLETVIIETVGAGQDEVDVVKLASVVVVVLTPLMGDDVQTMKAGLMEIADVFVINKSDQPGADRVASELEAMLSLGAENGGPRPSIVRTVASEDSGTGALMAAIEARPRGEKDKAAYWKQRLREMLRGRLAERVLTGIGDQELEEAAASVARRTLNPYDFVDETMNRFLGAQ